jgi:hypothetical protein
VKSPFYDLIPIDGEWLKREIRRRCQETLHRMERVRANLRQFHEDNEPAFDQWLNSQFGRDLTRIRELNHRAQELRAIIGETEEYRFLSRKSYRQAYEEVMRCRTNHEEPPADQLRRENREEQEELWGENEEFEFDREPLDDAYEEHLRGRHGSDQESDEGSDERTDGDHGDPIRGDEDSGRPRSPARADESGASRLKTLYRQLARKLHPDVNPGVDQKRRDLWNEVQDAYDRGDVDRLETLSAMGEVFDGGFSEASTVWSLRKLQAELVQGLWQLERQVRRLSKEPAWGFRKKLNKPGKLRVLAETYSKQFEWMRRDLEHDVMRGERTIESWKNAREKRSRA